MALGSRGAEAIFVCFSGEDSGQTGEAAGEPRVARCSRSRHLSNAPGLARQLAANRKDSAREGGCSGEKAQNLRLIFPCFLSVFARVFDLAPDVGFDELGIVGKLALPSLARFWFCGKPS
jgi:hypothetical protein